MKILSIETSCDETAVSIIEANGELESPSFKVLGNALFSKLISTKNGGVYPMLAKREHAKNLPTLLKKAMEEASVYTETESKYPEEVWREIKKILLRRRFV